MADNIADELASRARQLRINPFEKKVDSWSTWYQRFLLKMTVQGLNGPDHGAPTLRRNLLLESVGSDLFQQLVETFQGADLLTIDYQRIVDYLNSVYAPVRSFLTERVKFVTIMRKPEQSVNDFLSYLRAAAMYCKFGASLEERLRDQFLTGLQNPDMQEALFRAHPEDNADLVAIMRTALIVETAQQQRKTIEGVSSSSVASPISKIVQQPKHSKNNQQHQQKKPSAPGPLANSKSVDSNEQTCTRCGKCRHQSNETCPAINSKCRSCGIVGHWDVVCFKSGKIPFPTKPRWKQPPKPNFKKQSANAVNDDSSGAYSHDIGAIDESVDKNERYILSVIINHKKRVVMEYDTAAYRTIISQITWKSLGSPPLTRISNLSAYPKFTIKMLGEAKVTVSLGTRSLQLSVAVTEASGGVPLFGRDWISAFGLQPNCDFVKLETLSTANKNAAAVSAVSTPVDDDIEKCVSTCVSCQQHRSKEPETPISPWNTPDGPWDRIHIDFTGPYEGYTWFVVIDAYSRWLEIFPLTSTTTDKVISILRNLFSRYGICKTIVSDNGTQFTSDDFKQFCNRNGITHIRSTPYHSRTNGMVERVNQTFKRHYAACKSKYSNDFNHRLNVVLFTYRSTPHSSTGRTPAELFLGRRLPTLFDRLKPNVRANMDTSATKMKNYKDRHTNFRSFLMGESVWVLRESGSGWVSGKIKRQLGQLSYLVEIDGIDRRKHADQLRSRVEDEKGEKSTAQDNQHLQNLNHFDDSILLPTTANAPALPPEQPPPPNIPPAPELIAPDPINGQGQGQKRYPTRINRKPPQRFGY